MQALEDGSRALRSLIYAQLSFFGFLALATVVTTVGFTDNNGLSFYGVHYPVVIPFALGLVLCNLFLVRAAHQLPRTIPPFDKLQPALWLITLLVTLVLLTPSFVGSFFHTAHVTVSSLLFAFELLLGLWLTLYWNNNKLAWFLLTAQFVAGLVAMLSQLQIVSYLSQGSLLFQLFFGLLLIWSVSQLIDRVRANEFSK